MADWASARRVPSGEAHEVWTRKKSMKRTKIDTRVDLRFVCIDCSGGAVKAAHVMEKKQEVFFFNNEKLQIIPFGHIFTWTASPVQPFNTGGYSRGTDDGGGGEREGGRTKGGSGPSRQGRRRGGMGDIRATLYTQK